MASVSSISGSGGGYALKTFQVTPGEQFPYVVGAAGVAGVSPDAVTYSSSSGGTTSWGSGLSATGANSDSSPSSSPGSGSGGLENVSGGQSAKGMPSVLFGVGFTPGGGGVGLDSNNNGYAGGSGQIKISY